MPAILATSAILCPGHANLLMVTSDQSGLQVLDWSAHSDDCEVYLTNYDDSGPPGTGQTCNLRALPRNWALGGSVLVLARTDQGAPPWSTPTASTWPTTTSATPTSPAAATAAPGC